MKRLMGFWFMPLMVLAILLYLTGPGWALTIMGEPEPIGSWTQRFVEGGKGFDFDTMEVRMMEGGSTFKGTGFEDISVPGWEAQVLEQSSAAQASGPATGQIFFDLYFSSDLNVPFVFEFFAYLNGMQVDYATATWSGSAWSIEPVDLAMAVPLPGGLVLLGAGLLRLAAYRRRRGQD